MRFDVPLVSSERMHARKTYRLCLIALPYESQRRGTTRLTSVGNVLVHIDEHSQFFWIKTAQAVL
jgi:hypothetical protein